MLIDSHCHLNEEKLFPIRKQIIKESQEAGVMKFIVIGYSYDSSLRALKIAHEFEQCYAVIGIIPTEIESMIGHNEKEFFELLKDDKVVALGEIGLDYHWEKDPSLKERQKQWFIKQIEIANQYRKPIVIHSREAINETLEILKAYPPLYHGVMHCYSGSKEMMGEFLKLGLYIGIDGPVTFTNGRVMKEVVQVLPKERMLLETDCPYLTPHPFRGEMNSPKYLPLIAKEVANLKRMSEKEVAQITYDNTMRLFNL